MIEIEVENHHSITQGQTIRFRIRSLAGFRTDYIGYSIGRISSEDTDLVIAANAIAVMKDGTLEFEANTAQLSTGLYQLISLKLSRLSGEPVICKPKDFGVVIFEIRTSGEIQTPESELRNLYNLGVCPRISSKFPNPPGGQEIQF